MQAASLYPMLYRLERRHLITGRWVEKPGQRRRRFYRITAEGRRVLASQRSRWEEFITALTRVAGIRHA
ncbi:MAG: helix-turn-helix transcriptional regulator [Acidobacteria bacterium]|nr:helix-turn-helix transcriptional regulator [Acidobacteriota bacterium]